MFFLHLFRGQGRGERRKKLKEEGKCGKKGKRMKIGLKVELIQQFKIHLGLNYKQNGREHSM